MSSITALSSTLVSAVNDVQAQIKDVQTQLATGVKTLDAAQQGVVTRLTAQASGLSAASTNISQASSIVTVAQTALSSVATIMTQMKDLATKAASSGLGTADLASLNTTFQSLQQQVINLGTSATVNGSNLLSGAAGSAADLSVTTGISSAGAGVQTTVSAVDLATIAAAATLGNITSAANASTAITALQTALDSISAGQSSLAASQTGLSSQGKTVVSLATNLQNTIDSLQKVDQSAAQIKLQQLNNQQTIDFYAISQMNTEASAILSIFR